MSTQPSSQKKLTDLSELVSLAKRRGFIFQSSEIYGGLGSCWDYGPLGVELKNNVKSAWWRAMTKREDVVGIDASILMHPNVWKASGHVDNFTDPLVDCKLCKSRFRADKIDISKPCPECKQGPSFTESRLFNLMFQTKMGAVEDSSALVYLRPETAQGIFVNFLNVQTTMRKKIPFGIAQIGKSFRNEITPGNFIFRTREFEQMEMQFFIKPGTQKEWMSQWKQLRWNWHLSLGINPSNLRFHPHGPGELAHYADMAEDIEYNFPMGWSELEGVHSRTDFDLSRHQELSGKSLQYVDQLDGNQKFIPYVLETAVGLDRTVLAILCDSYEKDTVDGEERVVLHLHPKLAPIKVAVMPLMKKPQLEERARAIYEDLNETWNCDYDVSGSIGKRYRRQDEVGTPFCLTLDFDSLQDNCVTLRDRDSMTQERVSIDRLQGLLKEKLK